LPRTTATVPSGRSFASTTTSVVASGVAGRDELNGALSLKSPATLVPLHGPHQWTLDATHRVASTLLCGSRSSVVDRIVRLTQNRTCQLDITVATGAPTAWTLTLDQ
jgi:hypothetical protein